MPFRILTDDSANSIMQRSGHGNLLYPPFSVFFKTMKRVNTLRGLHDVVDFQRLGHSTNQIQFLVDTGEDRMAARESMEDAEVASKGRA